jgi:hypothetical protein
MTSMSDYRCDRDVCTLRNCVTAHARSRVARPLHGDRARVLFPMLLSMLLVGCILPPTLGVEQQDAGIDSPPAILSVSSDDVVFPEGVTVLIAQGQTSPLNLTLIDTDLGDTLYVSVFVDYTLANQTSPRSTCSAPLGTALRSTSCNLTALCLSTDINVDRSMQIYVFDRPPLDSPPAGSPSFITIAPGGESTYRTYDLLCQSASS